jgi:hypothetical protein
MIGRGNRNTQRNPAPVPLSLPQTATSCPDENPDRRGGKPASNHLRYGTVKLSTELVSIKRQKIE